VAKVVVPLVRRIFRLVPRDEAVGVKDVGVNVERSDLEVALRNFVAVFEGNFPDVAENIRRLSLKPAGQAVLDRIAVEGYVEADNDLVADLVTAYPGLFRVHAETHAIAAEHGLRSLLRAQQYLKSGLQSPAQ
jgi:hypothetical protein